jgi:hypothetical protein
MTSNATGMIGYFNKSRLAPYQAHSRDDHETRALYLWNIELSAAFQEILAIAEVALRNALDDALGAWNATQTKPNGQPYPTGWINDPAAPLAKLTTKTRQSVVGYAQTARAKRAPTHPRKNAPISHNDLLAQTTFGDWNNLMPVSNPKANTYSTRKFLWEKALKNAFPNLASDPHGHATANRVKNLHALRNRVSHMEPLLDVAVEKRHNDLLQLLTAIDPALRAWVEGISRVPRVAVVCPTATPVF